MPEDHHDDDLVASKTEGFKVGEKKTLDEYAKLDQEDESLARWKASLGIGASTGESVSDPNDPRTCIIHSLALEVEGRPDIVVDLTKAGALEHLKDQPFTIKEGAQFRMKAKFKVQHNLLSGLKYLQKVKRKGLSDKSEEMIGSYPPNTTDKPLYEKKFNTEEAPSGMLYRGHYKALSKFVDDDDHVHLDFEWSFDIAKDWTK